MDELRPIQQLTKPLVRFLHIEAASGVVLIVATTIALIAANTATSDLYSNLLNTPLTVGLGKWSLTYPLWYWVNDGLMTVFFFLVGLEIKRELVSGELKDPRRVIAPAAAAIGGALIPAVIYLFLLGDHPGVKGWAIPMATDIAFVVGILAVLGKRVPHGLRVFLLTLAIVDDIIAVLVIAIFYSGKISLIWLALAGAGIVLVLILNRLGVRTVFGYLLVGAIIWLCTLKSGIHPTISGVILGLITPASPLISIDRLREVLNRMVGEINKSSDRRESVKLREITEKGTFSFRESISPLERFEADVHPWAAFVIMPIFALANAGVPFSLGALTSPIAVAVAISLLIGKPLGIVLTLIVVVKSRLGIIPGGSSWMTVVGAGCLAGIGFTMSLFVASLSLEGALLTEAKSGILIGSAVSGVIGFTILALSLKGEPRS